MYRNDILKTLEFCHKITVFKELRGKMSTFHVYVFPEPRLSCHLGRLFIKAWK
jgi:hypothetical protein